MAKKSQDSEAGAPVKARVLAHVHHNGKLHAPNAVITAPASEIKTLEDQGAVDSDEAAVAYAEKLAAKAAEADEA